MEAGRELDALVAEKVMGWRVDRQSGNSPWLVCLSAGRWSRVDDHPFSTDIGAAWAVVEKLRADGWSIEVRGRNGRGDKWQVEIWQREDAMSDANGCADHPNVATAICLAALEAVGQSIRPEQGEKG